MKPAVVMLTGTMVDPEPRLEKVARFLVRCQWDVSVVAWDRTSTLPRDELGMVSKYIEFPFVQTLGQGFQPYFPY